jgi:hypothetical protein
MFCLNNELNTKINFLYTKIRKFFEWILSFKIFIIRWGSECNKPYLENVRMTHFYFFLICSFKEAHSKNNIDNFWICLILDLIHVKYRFSLKKMSNSSKTSNKLVKISFFYIFLTTIKAYRKKFWFWK